MLTGQVKKVFIKTEEQARTFGSLIGSDVIVSPSSNITAVMILPEIIYLYPTRSDELKKLMASTEVRKIVACPVRMLDKYGWSNKQNVKIAGVMVREEGKYQLLDYTQELIECGQEWSNDEIARISTVVQAIYHYIT